MLGEANEREVVGESVKVVLWMDDDLSGVD